MKTIDLVTGFLGSGKTTFIKLYASWLISQGESVCILENDYGAVNVDMMLLQDLGCDIEMVAGGCDYDCHKRRFRTKLISMGMLPYTRVIVEPSGIFDPDEFFDALQDEPLDRWYKAGNVFTIVDVRLPEQLSAQSEYVLASEAACAGKVILSHYPEGSVEQTVNHLNRVLTGVRCKRQFSADDILYCDWNDLPYEKLVQCGYHLSSYQKQPIMEENDYETLYLMNEHVLLDAVPALFQDPSRFGHVIRVKGFMPADIGDVSDDNQQKSWLELNATADTMDVKPIAEGQNVVIIIGERLEEKAIHKMICS